MSPEHIIALAEAQREYQHTCENGWVLKVRLPERRVIRRAVLGVDDKDTAGMNEAAERLALASIIGWSGVTLADVGLGDSAGIDPKAAAPFVPALVAALLGDRLDLFDPYQQDFMRRVNDRIKLAQADEKNSASA
jgi:hypothetical protein